MPFGISMKRRKDPEREWCKKCKKDPECEWCNKCNAKRFQENFENWTSGNNNIDKFIQNTQLSANNYYEVLEWIPYDRFYDVSYVAKGGFGKVYRANWIDGNVHKWDNKNKNWDRYNQNNFVALKSLDNSKNVRYEFINEIISHHKVNGSYIITLYGITQDPETKNYMMVLQYAENGSLRNYLNKINKSSSYNWVGRIKDLYYIAYALNKIHEKDLIHQDLHIGNILKYTSYSCITDMGLCKPADYDNTTKSIYGVLPYVAPEILRGQNYTKASDIYSFGIMMYEVFSGLPPYYDVSHDENLAIKICNGLRPRFTTKVPQLIVDLIKRCLDANPLIRPTANELQDVILLQWNNDPYYKEQMQKQIKEADKFNHDLEYERHPNAIYTSRLLNFNNLPEPKNSDDYYHEQNDNIISKEFSESLKIDSLKIDIS